MKIRILISLVLAFQVHFGIAQIVTIPDPILKNELVLNSTINTNQNTEIEVSEAVAYTGNLILSSGLGVSDLTGLQAFKNVTYLDFSYNSVSAFDGNGMDSLKTVFCNNNFISNLYLGGNFALEFLDCSHNQISNLQVGSNSKLYYLDCRNNYLTGLTTYTNSKLNFLDFSSNYINSIYLSSNLELAELSCDSNQLSSIDVSANYQLTNFSCASNQITALDVYANTLLQIFHCCNNQLSNLDVTNNLQLIELNCSSNQLNSLDVSLNTALTYLDCSYNTISNLSVLTNTSLYYLDCGSNQLTTLDVSNNTAITDLRCYANQISTLDVTSNTLLAGLHCTSNSIGTLNLSNCAFLFFLDCSNNQLSSLNVQNGNNAYIGIFTANNNPPLSCILVSDTNFAIQNWSGGIDPGMTFGIYCGPCTINIPDQNFKTALLNNLAINLDGNGEIDCSEAAAFNGTLDVSSLGIADLTGIEAFPALTLLVCNNNLLTSVSLSANTQLNFLDISYNHISNLNVTANTALSNLVCNNSYISTLDLSNNPALLSLECQYNLLTELNLSVNSVLSFINCSGNLLNNLNIQNGFNHALDGFNSTNNPFLYCIQVDDSAQMNLDWFQNKDAIATFSNLCTNCSVNIPDPNFKAVLVSDPYININGNSEIECAEANAWNGSINVNGLGISDLTGIEAFVNCISLRCDNNQLSNLDLSSNTKLTNIKCNNNSISSLILPHSVDLHTVVCSGNQLSSLDLALNPGLYNLSCSNNQITALDLSQNLGLVQIECAANQLNSLNLQNGNNNNVNFIDLTNNALLTCIQVDDTAYSNLNWSLAKDAIASFSTNCNCPLPAAAGIISGLVNVAACTNQLGIVYSIDTIANATGYLWTLPPLAGIVSNSDTTSVVVDYDAYSTSGYVTVAGKNQCGTGPAASLQINFKPIPVVQICGATVDSATQKTIISWERASESYVNGYVVFRENGGAYQAVDTVPNTPPASFLDTGSAPTYRSEKYKIAVLDSCGNVGDSSSIFQHQTMYLYGYVGAGSIAKIYWTDYIGNPDPNRYYNVMRDTSGNGDFEILAANLPKTTLSYTDMSSGGFNNSRYYIDMFSDINCDPTMRTMASRSTSRSNIKNKGTLPDSLTFFTGIFGMKIPQNDFSIYPNPAKDLITIVLPNAAVNYTIAVFDLLGKEVLNAASFINNRESTVQLHLNGLKKGLYVVKVKGEKSEFIRKLAIE